jgi:Ca2+-binding EF-hand superfamily protein
MKTLTSILSALALATTFATAADAPAKGEKKKADPEAMFKKLDADGNGSLSLEEFKAGPMGKKDPAKAEEIFKKKDTNNDGSLSLQEFEAHGGKGGKKKAS